MKKMTLTALSLVVALAATTAFAASEAKPPLPPKDGPHHGGPGHHMMFKGADANNDGVITKDEWAANGEKMFDKIDTNHDGKISKEEIKAHHDRMRAKMEKRMEQKGGDNDHIAVPNGVHKQ